MSRRITTKTTINDKDLAIKALDSQGWQYRAEGDNVIYVESGPLRYCTINLKTGEIAGDTDHQASEKAMLALMAPYNEAMITQHIEQHGYIDSREVNAEGNIEIVAQVTFA